MERHSRAPGAPGRRLACRRCFRAPLRRCPQRLRIGASVETLAAVGGHALAVVRTGSEVRILRAAADSDDWSEAASLRVPGAQQQPEPDLAVSGASIWLVAGPSAFYVSSERYMGPPTRAHPSRSSAALHREATSTRRQPTDVTP